MYATQRLVICNTAGQTVTVGPGDKLEVTENTAENMLKIGQASKTWPIEDVPEGDEDVEYSKMKKDELVSLAELRDIDASGTKDDIVLRLMESDDEG